MLILPQNILLDFMNTNDNNIMSFIYEYWQV